jgi:putative protease
MRRTAQGYRRAIDDAVAGRPFDIRLLGQLQGLANHGYTDGFYQRHHTQAHQNYMRGASETDRSQYVGDVLGVQDGSARIDVKNRFAVGDRIEVVHPKGNRDITVTRMLAEDGSAIEVAPGSGHVVRIELDAALDRALLTRYL